MKSAKLRFAIVGALALAACGNAAESTSEVAKPATDVTAESDKTSSADVPATSEPPAYAVAPTGSYTLDKTHGYIVFSYVHQGYSRPFLRWRDWDANIDWNSDNPEQSSVNVTINAAGIDSGVDIFDEHLRDEKFFDVTNHPEISFQSTSVSKSSDSEGTITGDLTIKGQTHPVTLSVTFNKAAFDGRSDAYKLGFSAKAEVKRSTWGLDLAVPYVSDEVELIIETEFVEVK